MLFILEKKKQLIDNLEYDVVFDYFDFMIDRFMIELDYFLSTDELFENLKEFDINSKLFEIVKDKLNKNKDRVLIEFKDLLQSEDESNIPLKNLDKKFMQIYEKIAEDEIEAVLNSQYTEQTKNKYKENLKITLKNILVLLANMVVEDFIEEIEDPNFESEPENVFFLFKMLFPDQNLLITSFKKNENKDPELILLDNIFFEKYINTENDFIVLVYFEETNTYERIIYESFDKSEKAVKQSKKYPFKYYNFPFDHFLINKLLN